MSALRAEECLRVERLLLGPLAKYDYGNVSFDDFGARAAQLSITDGGRFSRGRQYWVCDREAGGQQPPAWGDVALYQAVLERVTGIERKGCDSLAEPGVGKAS